MGSHRTRPDAELLAATQTEPAAFADFYARYERVLLAFFVARTRDPELAADLTAEVFASALEASGRFDQDRSADGTAAPWLFAIARNTLATSQRRGTVAAEARHRLGMREVLTLDDAAYDRVEELASLDLSALTGLADLPGAQRDAL
ncbi:MAG: RNA polymerase sigma factor, partial [Solirubrobacteraceae bacterium]